MILYICNLPLPTGELIIRLCMIYSKAVDVEIFPNLFSVGFVDLADYMKTFADCVDADGKPIPLTDKLSVKEINERLDKVKKDMFYISDTDDSQLLDLVSYINNMESGYNTIITDNGVKQIPYRTDLYGFHNSGYDDIIIKAFMMYFNRFDHVKYLIKKLKDVSDRIIALQDDKSLFYQDEEITLIRKYRLPYATVDVQQIYGLHSAGVNIIDGERVKFGKSLKQTSINLKWHELLDFTLPLIDEEERELYWNKLERYRGRSVEELNSLHFNDFSRYVLPKYVKIMLHYNFNDIYIVCEIVRQKPEEVKLRYAISNAFKINVLCSSRANIADKLTTMFYSKMSGLEKSRFEKGRTERTKLSFKRIIFPHIKFKTKQLQELLEEMKTVSVYHTNKDAFCKEITFYGTTYTLACGGIHTQDSPVILKSDDKYVYKHFDYNSYYPSIMVSYEIAPEHLNRNIFVKMVKYFRDTRVKCKHTSDDEGYVMNGVPNKIAAEALKIVINSIYGKFGSDIFFLYDRLAQLKVTINGQLMTMSLVEALELEGIHVISANTDGIIIKLPRNKIDVFNQITKTWNEENRMGADSEDYEAYFARDVNNYFAVWADGKIDAKGALDSKQYIKELKKGYDMPVVALAVFNYLYHNIPVMETLHNHTNILDFCKTQNVGRQFNVVYSQVVNGKIVTVKSQRHVRFYVSTKGVLLQKEHVDTLKRSNLASGLPVILLNSLDDVPISDRNIDYKYYYNECYKIIDPIKLGISPSQKADKSKGIVSGRLSIRKKSRQYLSLFDDDDFEQ